MSSQVVSTATEAAGGASGPISTSPSSVSNGEALVDSLMGLGVPGGGMLPTRIACRSARQRMRAMEH